MSDASVPGYDEDDGENEGEGVLDKLRDMPVGVADPNIIGDCGPTDVPPGTDGPTPAVEAGELDDEVETYS